MKNRQLIADLVVGSVVTVPLLFKSGSIRKTKTGKPYATFELTDGVDSIGGNAWNFAGTDLPIVNDILEVNCQITEWNGSKQLNIQSYETTTEYGVEEFAPTGKTDVATCFAEACSLASDINNDLLRNICLHALQKYSRYWKIVPGAKGIHHAYVGGTLIHSVSVAKIAKAIATTTKGASVDLCVAGALLHDVGKLASYSIDGAVIDLTDDGKMLGHIPIGYSLLDELVKESWMSSANGGIEIAHELINLLGHIILSHHGKLEYGSPVQPLCAEAYIVHYADTIDATTEQLFEASSNSTNKWTDKLWALGNTTHISQVHVNNVLEKGSELFNNDTVGIDLEDPFE